jgi:hypothetical protein
MSTGSLRRPAKKESKRTVRKRSLLPAAALTLLYGFASTAYVQAQEQKKPNILFIKIPLARMTYNGALKGDARYSRLSAQTSKR